MAHATKMRRLYEDVGELLARHEGGRDLDQFVRYRDRDHPLLSFIEEELDVELWERQVEMVHSVEDNRRTVAVGANATGKDFAASCISLAWVFVYGGQVLVTASAERTAGGVFMRRQVAPRFQEAPQLGGELYTMELRIPGRPESGIVAMTSTSAAKIAGFHAARTLVVLTEANDVPEFAWESLVGGSAMGESDRVLAVGNPLSPEGRFFTVARSAHWTKIHMPASEHPNIVQGREVIVGGPSLEGRRMLREDWGADSPQFQARWEARFPDTAINALIDREDLEKAVERHRRLGEPEGPYYVVGVDPARHGPDETVCCIRRGGFVVGFESWRGEDTQESGRRVARLVRRLHDGGRSPVAGVYLDAIGLPGVADKCREELNTTWLEGGSRGYGLRTKKTRVVDFKSSNAAPDNDRFLNVRAQAFYRVRKLLEEDALSLPDDRKLLEELRALRIEYNTSGKIQIGSKKQLKARIGRSPDRADALAMSLRPELVDPNAKRVRIR